VEVAEKHRAALFISVHADSVAEDYVRGATVYTLSDEASDGISAALAARENRSDILAGLSLEDQPTRSRTSCSIWRAGRPKTCPSASPKPW
jgi:N-acetylmuramoyl-L-alanine amidase